MTFNLNAAEIVKKSIPDLRVLIDVSGSMKKNDPANLRRPALRLLVGLLPADSQAEIWIFADKVSRLVNLSKVNSDWKEQAGQSSEDIHSRGLFTDIEKILIESTKGWGQADKRFDRSVILLTDGVVDVSKVKSESLASRKRILEKVLPELSKKGVTLYTVALSEHADHDLLKKIALGTDGWYEQVNDAQRLQRIFLHLFEKAAPPETLPMTDNKFTVDKSIDEITLLVFRSKSGRNATIIRPDKTRFDEFTLPDDVKWHPEETYDLVTIKKPMQGEWRVVADVDPDNRVMVVTNLSLRTSALPNNIVQGETFDVSAQLQQDGGPIQNKLLMDVIRMEMIHIQPDQRKLSWPLNDKGRSPDEKAGDGVFTALVDEIKLDGVHAFIIIADGKTFKRQSKHTVNVRVPVMTTLLAIEKDQGGGYRLVIEPRQEVIDPKSMRVDVTLIDPNGDFSSLKPDSFQNGTWDTKIQRMYIEGEYRIKPVVMAKSLQGTPLNIRIPPFNVKGEKKPEGYVPEEKPIEPEKPKEPEKVVPEKNDYEIDWTSLGIAIGAANAFLIIFGLLGYRYWKKKTSIVDIDID